jgi:hypothetical protein
LSLLTTKRQHTLAAVNPSNQLGGEQPQEHAQPTKSHISVNSHDMQDPAVIASQEADTLAQAAITAAHTHAKAVQEVARLNDIWEIASKELLEAEAARKMVEPPNKANESLVRAAVMHWETALNKQSIAFLEVKAANRAEHKASEAAQKAVHAAHLAQEKAEKLLTADRHQKTPIPTKPITPPHPLGPQNPSIFVELIPLPKPGARLDGPLPYEGASSTMITSYRTMERWVSTHDSHFYILNDIFPGKSVAIGWLQILKKVINTAKDTRKRCVHTADAQTAELMIKWLEQLRKLIHDIGRVPAARDGVRAEMDDVHTDDEAPLPAPSQKSQSKHPSRSGKTTMPANTATICPMDQSQVVTMANSKITQDDNSAEQKKFLTLIAYSAAPPAVPLFAQYICSKDKTCMEAKLVTTEKQNKNLIKFVNNFSAPDTNIKAIVERVYTDKVDMTNLCTTTKEVNDLLQAVNTYPVGNYSPEDGYKVHVMATLFENTTIPRVAALVLAKIIYSDYESTNERVMRAKDLHTSTLATLLVMMNQHTAFRKNRYKTATRTYIGPTFTAALPAGQVPPPPPPMKGKGPVKFSSIEQQRNKANKYTVETPGTSSKHRAGLGFRRGGTHTTEEQLVIHPPRNEQLRVEAPPIRLMLENNATPNREATPTPNPHSTPVNNNNNNTNNLVSNRTTPPTLNQPNTNPSNHINTNQNNHNNNNQDNQTNRPNSNNPNQHNRPPNYNNMNHQSNFPDRNNNDRNNNNTGFVGHPDVQEFPADRRGQFEFYGNAPEKWPAYAHYFMYQPEQAEILEQYIEVPGARQNFKVRSVQWQLSDTLRIDDDFPDWNRNIFQFKLKFDPNIVNHTVTYVTALWAGLHPGLQETLEHNIMKTAGDNGIPTAIFMAQFWRKAGAMEWLLFNIHKYCRCHHDDRKQKAIKILTNATVTPNGDNIAKALNEVITAGDLICGEGGDKFPFSFAVEHLVRSLQYCHVNNASKAIRDRQVQTPFFDDNGIERNKYVIFDITCTKDEQVDRLANGEIDWKNRWAEIKQTARGIISSISSGVPQNPRANEYYPVYIKDWIPIEIVGVNKGAGPKPPTYMAQKYQTDVPGKPILKRKRDYESPGRSRDSGFSGYESDSRSQRTYNSRDSNPRFDRNKGSTRYAPKTTYRREQPSTSRKDQEPSETQVKIWYKAGNTCLFCGERKEHKKYADCPHRNTHFPNWSPNWSALTNKNKHVQAYAMQTTPSNPPNKYPHMSDDQGRGRIRERDRDLSREPRRDRDRSNSRNPRPSQSAQNNLPPPPALSPRQVN